MSTLLQKIIKEEKLVIGTKRTLKAIKNGKLDEFVPWEKVKCNV